MNIWLVTTGSSDVQLTTDEHWNDWYQEIKKSIYRLRFAPTRAIDDDERPYRLAARVLGIAYDHLPDEVGSCLDFPLLNGFTQTLKDQKTDIDRIVILMSNQENIFPEAERDIMRCPYWQDTCELYPILEGYFRTQFPEAMLMPLVLKPDSLDRGLDDWDAVLMLVRREIGSLDVEPEKVYVSHQAGTPAISSAVQFASLARFGDRVQFLVSNEYDADKTRTIASSEYLEAIRLQEAKALLDRYDYAGVEALLGSFLATKNPQAKRLGTLLRAAIEWNHAEFHKFKNILTKEGVIASDDFPWWRAGYESAYLAVIRLNQGNTVDALFHSFRSFEGSIIACIKDCCKPYLKKDEKRGWQVQSTISNLLPGYKATLYPDQQENLRRNRLGLFSGTAYGLLEQIKPGFKDHQDCQIALDSAKDQRNVISHHIEGLQEEEVFQAWETKNLEAWAGRVLRCLNFIADKDFRSLEEASLMPKSA
ncbi:MAG: hypothetical protein HC780_20550 [Leptolyngbyaceae cyanobacterium CSU_1_3]|nr:hypothetical protein [Leptolyngbyaceae cyanobacterium CSU_1_3]